MTHTYGPLPAGAYREVILVDLLRCLVRHEPDSVVDEGHVDRPLAAELPVAPPPPSLAPARASGGQEQAGVLGTALGPRTGQLKYQSLVV